MNIHHAIVKSAAAKGVILTSDDTLITAHIPSPLNVRVTLGEDFEGEQAEFNDLARTAWANAQDICDFRAENPTITIVTEDGDFVAYHTSPDATIEDTEIARDPELEDLFETVREALANGDVGGEEAGDEDEEETGKGVVPEKYKQQYAAAGHPNHCGDWLAETLNGLCRKTDGKKEWFDLDSMVTINDANGLDTSKYLVNRSNGWQGRYRMTTRNMLAKIVAAAGVLIVPDGIGGEGDREIAAPAEWCAKFAPKPKAAKPAKA